MYLAEGTINGDRFVHFVKECLLPMLMPFNGINPFSVVIMDNASIHHVGSVVALIRNMGACFTTLFPDLNPLGPVFGKVKSILKEDDALSQGCSAPKALISMAFKMITMEDCINYSRYCGYMHF